MGRLDGRVAIVTGAARGMGAATARIFAGEGAHVVLADVLAADGEAVARQIGRKSFFYKLDVTNEDEWKALVAEVKRRLGRIDILINNAAIVHFGALEDLTKADLERVLAINVVGTMMGLKTVTPVMKAQKKGAIVNISSVDGLKGCNGLSAYTASKWAVRGVSKSMALELGPHGIRVNSVHPGGVDTVMGNPTGESKDTMNKESYGLVPLQRIGEPEEIARASLFLVSDEASYITGAELAVDGGWTAGFYQTKLPGAPGGNL